MKKNENLVITCFNFVQNTLTGWGRSGGVDPIFFLQLP